ncbi:MAG: hypothetical protein AB7F25_12450 [Deferribacterales bacterium]
MTGLVSKAIIAGLTKVLSAFLAEKVLTKVIIGILKILATRTTNTLDDELVVEVEKALGE